MKKVVIRETGGPEVLHFADSPDPMAGDDDVLVDIKAVGLNWSEVMIRRGKWAVDLGGGFTPGAEGAGIIEAVGKNVVGMDPGDRVAVFEVGAYMNPTQGCYAEKIAVEADKTLKIPDRLEFAEAAAIPMAALTAYDAMIFHSPLPDEGVALITACTGAVGIAAMQIARRNGLRVIGTTRDAGKRQRIAAFGVEPVVESDPYRLKEEIEKLIGDKEGLDYVFDPIGGELAEHLFTLMNLGGTYVGYGGMGGDRFTVTTADLLFHQIAIHGYVVLRNLADPDILQEVWSEVYPLIETKEIGIPVAKTFPFADVAAAHKEMEEHQYFGKLVLVR